MPTITIKDIEDATKKVQTTKVKGNFLRIDMRFDGVLILPFEDGKAFIASLANAERSDSRWGTIKQIRDLESDDMEATMMSRRQYERIKIAALLNVDVEELSRIEAAEKLPP